MGVMTGLVTCQMPFNIIMTGIGVISLAGVVVKNAIVLLDYTRLLQRRGMGLIEASVEAGVTRMRPVLLTAVATVIGLVPVALGISFDFHTFSWALRSESAEWWRPMAVAVIFGLTIATVLTLVVVPTLYVSLYRLAARWGLGGLTRPSGESQVEPAPTA
jgi:multidrug efflux pump subunit AcrB